MPRKPIIYTSDFPYHVMARANNREWFYLPIEAVWQIFAKRLNFLVKNHGVKVYAFVLMNNHYHLLISTSPKMLLGEVMQWLQKSVSRNVNELAGRTNHVFGGPYKGCLIGSPAYYAEVLKYTYRNPLRAGLCHRVDHYRYSTISLETSLDKVILTKPDSEFLTYVPAGNDHFLAWLNDETSCEMDLVLSKVLKKTEFKVSSKESKFFAQRDFESNRF